jgi:hypothetical protein
VGKVVSQEWALVRPDRAVLPAASPVAVAEEEWLGRASEDPVVLNSERRCTRNSQIPPADYATASIFRTWMVLAREGDSSMLRAGSGPDALLECGLNLRPKLRSLQTFKDPSLPRTFRNKQRGLDSAHGRSPVNPGIDELFDSLGRSWLCRVRPARTLNFQLAQLSGCSCNRLKLIGPVGFRGKVVVPENKGLFEFDD